MQEGKHMTVAGRGRAVKLPSRGSTHVFSLLEAA